eukprot:GEMP01129801.1.p1 GENE.GEMP01129801.1~~GEMP01129801.1.p1  ORF type:complete len:106 (-),score=9.75 GEMP01129801.1:94-411(-)
MAPLRPYFICNCHYNLVFDKQQQKNAKVFFFDYCDALLNEQSLRVFVTIGIKTKKITETHFLAGFSKYRKITMQQITIKIHKTTIEQIRENTQKHTWQINGNTQK